MGRPWLLWPLRIAVPGIFLMLMVTFIRFPQGSDPEGGMVRLSWRTIGERVRTCQQYTSAELQTLTDHMRTSDEYCQTVLLPYRLRAWMDGKIRVERIVRPAGWRGDRPLFVNEELPAARGGHHLKVAFEPVRDETGPAGQASDPESTAQRAWMEAIDNAPLYLLEEQISIEAGKIVMVGLNEDAEQLFLLGN